MLEYWWLIAIPVLLLALAPTMVTAAAGWRAQRRAVAINEAGGSEAPGAIADFVWIAGLLMAFLVLINYRP